MLMLSRFSEWNLSSVYLQTSPWTPRSITNVKSLRWRTACLTFCFFSEIQDNLWLPMMTICLMVPLWRVKICLKTSLTSLKFLKLRKNIKLGLTEPLRFYAQLISPLQSKWKLHKFEKQCVELKIWAMKRSLKRPSVINPSLSTTCLTLRLTYFQRGEMKM